MALHPLAVRFAEVADAYERGRPGYSAEAIAQIAAKLGLSAGSAVLDLAAGTGKLTRGLLAYGLDVTAVEPQAPLRELLAGVVGAERALDGTAEAIPLADATMAAVTVADAFHWFEAAAALPEIARVLEPGGSLAVLITYPDWSGASWAHELGSMLAGARPEHPHFNGPPWQQAVRASGLWQEPSEIVVASPQPIDASRIVDYLASFSWVAAMAAEDRQAFLSRGRELIETGSAPAEMPMLASVGVAKLL
ncbi:MAG TPA: class I SAM-dependent methyltransferase [Solirubrobacteraceae bacterium]|nr:class I SAM-dependent methyltransferase [Solirubrobacteraceae bacterium]